MNGSGWGDEQRWNQFYASNYNYYATNDYAWTSTGLSYTTLKNVVQMEAGSQKSGLARCQRILGPG